MRRRKLPSGEKSVHAALIFFLFLALLVGCVFAIKIYLLFAAAKFDGVHQIVVEVDESSTKGRLISFNPDTQTSSILTVSGSAPDDFGKYLGIHVDVHVANIREGDNLTNFTQNLLFHPTPHVPLNLIDRIRLFLFANNIKATDITQKEIRLPADTNAVNNVLPQLFVDHTLYTENVSIGIVNATGKSGVGNAVAKMISNSGGNVISVSTADQEAQTTTLVYTGKASYTTKRLANMFGAKLSATTAAMLSEMVLTVGKDVLPNLSL